MSVWGVAIASVVSAGAGIYGAKKNADAIGGGSRNASRFQREALQTQIALNRPQLEVANSALGQLASIFGLQQPSQIDFDGLLSGVGGGSQRPATAAELQDAYRRVLGRDADPEGLQFYIKKGFSVGAFEQAARGSEEYRQKLEAGTLPASETTLDNATGQPVAPTQGLPTNLRELALNNPLVQLQQREGEQAIARGAAARGLNQSGGTLKDLTAFNSDLAAASIQNNVLNPLFQLAGFGSQAQAQLGGQISATGTNLGNLALGAADARGSAYQNAFNNIGNSINDIAGAYYVSRGGNTGFGNKTKSFSGGKF